MNQSEHVVCSYSGFPKACKETQHPLNTRKKKAITVRPEQWADLLKGHKGAVSLVIFFSFATNTLNLYRSTLFVHKLFSDY